MRLLCIYIYFYCRVLGIFNLRRRHDFFGTAGLPQRLLYIARYLNKYKLSPEQTINFPLVKTQGSQNSTRQTDAQFHEINNQAGEKQLGKSISKNCQLTSVFFIIL